MAIREKRDQYLVLFRGDDSDFVGNQQILLKLETELDLTGCKAHFRFLDFKQDFDEIPADKTLELVFPKSSTANFPLGAMDAELWLEDSTGKRRTVANRIHVVVTNSVKQAYDNDDPQAITVVITTGSVGSISWNNITGKPSTFLPSAHTHPISQVVGLQEELNLKVNKIQNATAGNLASLTSDGGIQNSGESITSLKEYTNTQVATNTANFLGTYDYATDLGFTPPATSADVDNDAIAAALTLHVEGTPTNNDYVFVQIDYTATTPADEFRRFKYNATADEWLYEYTLNSASFTPAQWAAINSGITGVVAPSSSATTGQAASAKATGDALAGKRGVMDMAVYAETETWAWAGEDATAVAAMTSAHTYAEWDDSLGWVLYDLPENYNQTNFPSDSGATTIVFDVDTGISLESVTGTRSSSIAPTTDELAKKSELPAVPVKAVKKNGTALTPDGDGAVNVIVPTKTSDLTNDSGFLTQHQQLAPVYSQTPTFSEWVFSGASAGEGYHWEAIWSDADDIWVLWKVSDSDAADRFDLTYDLDYSLVDATLLHFSGPDGDITATRVRTDIVGYTLGDQTTKPLQPQGEYAPAMDIPKSALASNVQTSLGKADTAVQPSALAGYATTAQLPYDLGTPITIDTASSEVVEGETVTYGAATLANRTANIVQVTAATPLDELRITFPAATSGKVRDFGLRVEIGTGSAALAAPALVPIAPTGETIKVENPDGAIPTLADGAADAKGVTLLYFSENPPAGTFLVKGEQVKEA